MKKKKTIEESAQDIKNIISKIQNIRKKIQEKNAHKLNLSELSVDNPIHMNEIERRLLEFDNLIKKRKDEANNRTQNLLKLNKLKEYDYFESWDLDKIKKKSLIQQIKSKLKGGVK